MNEKRGGKGKCLLYRTKDLAKGMGLNPGIVTCEQASFCGTRTAGSCPIPRIDIFKARLAAGTTRARARRA